ncbi:hypothetical protein BH93_07490 [Rhodococcoides fascians A25f]|uniref:hypothetical protein n=1 Tax=Rhodococcoides fascians TaxID=1828 RepID=UPI00068CF81C|nr:hypothetical protein [Rhodococcus fascians]QII05242.1 hypothetical protein BH93_07490 [Rhodococcus fascians A25f]
MRAGRVRATDARSIVMIVVGAVLALFFWDLRVFWFQGGPLGCVLMVLAVVDVWDSRRATDGRGIVGDLRDDIFGREDPTDTPDRDGRR